MSFASSNEARLSAEKTDLSFKRASRSAFARSPYSHAPSDGQKQKLSASRTRRYWAWLGI